MVAHDLGKLAVLLVTVVCATVLLALGVIPDAAGVGIITAALGYVTGNGRLAVRGEAPSPAVSPRGSHTPVYAEQLAELDDASSHDGSVRVFPPEGGWPE
jgi:hypothetical protein